MAISSLASRLMKAAGKGSMATVMTASGHGDKVVLCKTHVPILNVMIGGDLDGGITAGLTQIVGDSRTFKTNLVVEAIAAWLDHDPEAISVVFDCEFGCMAAFKNRCPQHLDRIIHVPFEDIEDLKFQFTGMLEDAKLGEKVFFFIDSVSQVASKKEVEDVIAQKDVTDMTRAKQLNSFFRIITPKLNLRQLPCWFVNSYYDDTTSQYAEPIIKGGKQAFLSSDALLFVTRSQDKDDNTKELLGWNFNYSAMKSRFVKEKSKFTIHVTYAGGIDPLSGMVELAKESGYLTVPTQGFYQFNQTLLKTATDRKYRMKEIMADPKLFDEILANQGFKDYVKDKYALSSQVMGIQTDEVDSDTGEVK